MLWLYRFVLGKLKHIVRLPHYHFTQQWVS